MLSTVVPIPNSVNLTPSDGASTQPDLTTVPSTDVSSSSTTLMRAPQQHKSATSVTSYCPISSLAPFVALGQPGKENSEEDQSSGGSSPDPAWSPMADKSKLKVRVHTPPQLPESSSNTQLLDVDERGLASKSSAPGMASRVSKKGIPKRGWTQSFAQLFKAKPPMATVEDVLSMKSYLMSQMRIHHQSQEAKHEAIGADLKQEVFEQVGILRVERNSQVQTAIQEIANKASKTTMTFRQEISAVEAELKNRMQDTVQRLEMEIQKAQSRTREELQQESKQIISEMRRELTAGIISQFDDMSRQLHKSDAEQSASIAQLREVTGKRHDDLQLDLASVKSEGRTLNVEVHKKCHELDRHQNELLERMNLTESALQALLNDEVQGAASRSEIEEKFALFQQVADRKFARLGEQTRTLRVAVAEVENLPTRRVEWQIPRARELLQSLVEDTSAEASLFSPEFEAGGAHGLQLELRLNAKDDRDDKEKIGLKENYCELVLWGGECTLSLIFRLYVGTSHVKLSHKFDGLLPCSTGPLCSWRNHISEDENSLSVGIEILEAIREVSLPSRLASSGGEGVVVDDMHCNFPWRQVEGALVSHRYLIHRTLDLVQDQVHHIKSRMVRRVEWRIERASELQRCFPPGDFFCSAPFDAGGLEGLQFMFYPSGNNESREGHCSFFICCQPGTMIHCWLELGKQRWDACSAFEVSRDYFGRSSFCRFDGCVDERDDTILAAMELQEAHQKITLDYQTHRPACQPVGGGQRNIESVVNLCRSPAPGTMEDVKILPSIWTSKLQENLEDELDNFHSFADIRTSRRPPTGRRIASGGRCRPPVTSPRCRPATASSFGTQALDRYQMYTC